MPERNSRHIFLGAGFVMLTGDELPLPRSVRIFPESSVLSNTPVVFPGGVSPRELLLIDEPHLCFEEMTHAPQWSQRTVFN